MHPLTHALARIEATAAVVQLPRICNKEHDTQIMCAVVQCILRWLHSACEMVESALSSKSIISP